MPDTPNATPTNYNSAYTGPQIDASVGAVLDKEAVWDEAAERQPPAGGADGQFLSSENDVPIWITPPFPVRPNILDNGYFVYGKAIDESNPYSAVNTFPINQRGQRSYSGNDYCFDRWRLNGNSTGNCTVTISQDGVTINNAGSTSNWLNQPFEAPLPAGTYTLSILTKAVSGTVRIELLNGSSPVGSYAVVAAGLSIHKVTIQDQAASANKFAIWLSSGSSASVAAVKLERGNEQTLAHQENGEWVLNELPDMAAEMARCRRFYQRFSVVGSAIGYSIANVMAYNSYEANLTLRLGMRVPSGNSVTVTYSNLSHIVLAAQLIKNGVPVSSIVYQRVTDSGDVTMVLRTAANALTVGAAYNAAIMYEDADSVKTNGWIAFSTEP